MKRMYETSALYVASKYYRVNATIKIFVFVLQCILDLMSNLKHEADLTALLPMVLRYYNQRIVGLMSSQYFAK